MQALGLVWGGSDSAMMDVQEIHTRITTPTQYGARLLLDHWQARAARGGFVVGRDVPSRALAFVLRNLALYEPMGADFRVRLAGTAFMRRFGRDITGHKLSEIYNAENFEKQRANCNEVVAKREPYVADVRSTREDRLFLRFEALRLPVLSPDHKETWVLGGVFYFDWS